jgi:hypothetical protein
MKEMNRRLAIARSAVSPSPFLRDPSPNCDQTKTRPSATGANSAHVRCSRYAESLVTAGALRVARSTEVRARDRAAAVSVLCRSSAGGRQAEGSPSDVVMSGVVDSGRQIGHGNIDANDLSRLYEFAEIDLIFGRG